MTIYSRTLKRLLGCVVALLGLSLWAPLTAQQNHYHINEDFSTFPNSTNPFPYKGWSNAINYGDYNVDFWDFSNPGGRTVSSPGDAEVAIFDADYYSFNWQDEDASLNTSFFDARGYEEVWVKFDHQFEAGGSAGWEIDAYDGFNWNNVASGNTQTSWETDSFDITSYCANVQNARVRFRWLGTWQNNLWWMIDNVQIYSPVQANNVTVVNAKPQHGLNGNGSDNITVTVRNLSDAALSNIPVKALIDGTLGGSPVNTLFSGTITGPLNPGDETTIDLGTFNSIAGGSISIKAYPEFAGDPSTDNDTFYVKGYDILGTPAVPTPPVFFRCGAGTVKLDGGIQTGNVGYWYSSANPYAQSLFSTSNTVDTKFLNAPSSQTVFLTQGKQGVNNALYTPLNGNYRMSWYAGVNQGGVMFTINPANNIQVDSFGIHLPNSNYTDVEVYYMAGSYVGFETDPSAWTLLGTANVRGMGQGNETYINVADMLIPSNQPYSIFIYSADDMISTSGSTTYDNGDFNIEGGTVIFNRFANYQGDFTWNGTIYYRNYTESSRVPVTGVALEAPAFSGFSAGTPFKGTFRDGDLRTPDLVANPDNIVYEVITPNTFLDKDHGPSGTWQIINTTFATLNGTPVPTADYVITYPSNAGKGKVSYTPSAAFTDSTLKLSMVIKRFDDQCDTTIERIVYVAPRPKSQFTISNGCVNADVTLDNTSNILAGTISHLWDFGDGTSSTYINPVKQYAAAGNYTVKLLITSALGYTDSITKNINIFAIPNADFNFVSACEGTAVTMAHTATLPPGTPSYDWNYGTNPVTTGTGATTSKLYSTAGIYNVSLKVTVNGCAASVSKFVTQAPRVAPNFNFTATQCDNGTVDFTNTTTDPSIGSVSYLWKFGDGNQSTSPSASHVYNNFMPYNVVLVGSTNLGCVDSVTKQVILRESPAASFTNTAAQCNNEAITFTNTSVVPAGFTNNYVWDFGDGKTSNDQDPVHQYDAPGDYTISLRSLSSNGCEGRIENSVTINLKPKADFVAVDVCKGNETNFMNGSFTTDNAALTYAWNFDNGGGNSVLENPTITYTNAGTYNVSLTATHPNGCEDVVTIPVNVFALPVADINSASRQTGDRTMNFATNATGAGYTYLWLFGDGGQSNVQNPSYSYSSDGLMIVRLVVTSGDGCASTATDTVIINSLSVNGVDGITNLVNVYPNPSAGRFVIDCTNARTEEINNIAVVDMLGRTIINNVEVNSAGKAEVDLTAVAAGIYYLNISTLTGTHTIKLNVSR